MGAIDLKQLTQSPKKIFLSYSDKSGFVQTFWQGPWFSDVLRVYEVEDYAIYNLAYGPLEKWIENLVKDASVFIAFFSQRYLESWPCASELTQAIEQLQRR